jgi:hypothetical protein
MEGLDVVLLRHSAGLGRVLGSGTGRPLPQNWGLLSTRSDECLAQKIPACEKNTAYAAKMFMSKKSRLAIYATLFRGKCWRAVPGFVFSGHPDPLCPPASQTASSLSQRTPR